MNQQFSLIEQQVEPGVFLKHLKASTARLHEQLEAQPAMLAIVAPGVTEEDYYWYLVQMKQVAEAYEKGVLNLLSNVLPVGNYYVTDLINKDLGTIHHQHKGQVNFYDPLWKLPSTTTSFALGFMYVMEGSRLGGSVILKNIREKLGYGPGSGAGYLSGFGVETGKKWKEFLAFFTGYIISQQGFDEAISGAKYAFETIYDFFESNRVNEHKRHC